MHSLLSLINTFDQDNHARGVQFEKLCKWILENHPLYKTKLKRVWLWDDWPERWGRDCGIDLVAEDVDGKTWAVQAKCYDPKNSVTKKDIDSFLSESANSKIHHRLLIATTDGIGANARAVIGRQNDTIPFSQMMLSNLLEAPLEWPTSIHELSTATVKKRFKPKPYQQKAIDNVVQNLDSRGQLIMACGTGKTLTGLWIDEKLNSNLTLVLLPSLLLLSKTLTEWLTHCKEPFSYLPVCSDDTVAKSEDAINLSTAELSFPTTTNADDIAKFVQGKGRKVIFSTYQSSEKIAEAFKSHNLEAIDLVIADEAHRCAGKTDSAYSTVLDNQQLPAAKRLFMTATPRIFQSAFKKKASDSGVEVMSMDDEAVFGPVLHKLSFGEAIEQDLLTDYQVVVVGINNSSYSAMIDERKLVKTDTDLHSDARSLASHIGLAKAIKNYDLRRVISFHSRVSSARDFANQLPEVIEWMPKKSRPDGELITDYVSGAMPTNERDKNLKALGDIADNQRYILSNARCLSEGVDVPALDGIAFVDPRNSEIDIVQAVGRAIRLSKGKALGSIVIPVFLEENDDVDEVLSSSPFKKVWAVVNALRAHDDDLSNELDQLRYKLGRRGSVGKSDKIVFDLPTTISHDFEEALKAKLIESTTASWEFWFGLLEVYQEENGDCLVPSDFKTQSNHSLGNWVSSVRSLKLAALTDKRKRRLDELGFVWDVSEFNWEQGFKFLTAYKAEHGHCYVPDKFKYKGFGLGSWIAVQIRNSSKLDLKKIERLNNIGFIWDKGDYAWEEGFSKLVKFKEINGHCEVPAKGKDGSGSGLNGWVSLQRKNQHKLKEKHWKRLDDLGFDWELPFDKQWNEAYSQLVAYKEKHGDCLVPGNHKTSSGLNLGSWLNTQISNKTKLSGDRLKQLNDVGVVWDRLAHDWEIRFSELLDYKNKKGDCLVPQKHKTLSGIKLGVWVTSLRTRKDNLTPDQVVRLNEIEFVWDLKEKQWKDGLMELKKYKDQHGDCSVPQKHTTPSGFRLGLWVSNRRANKSSLNTEQIIQLDNIGFIWDWLEWQWEKGFEALTSFKERFGHCNVKRGYETSEGYKLAVWINEQRANRDNLSKEKRTKLNKLGFDLAPLETQRKELLNRLEIFIKQNGHSRITRDYKDADGYPLGAKVKTLRNKRTIKTLTKEFKLQLESLGFVFNLYDRNEIPTGRPKSKT
jgi:superfamily II DNA or RNA helicase